MGLQEEINQRVSFLKEQIHPAHNRVFNMSLEVQIRTLRSADPKRVGFLILQKRKELERCRDLTGVEVIHSEIEALEWLQRQVVKYL